MSEEKFDPKRHMRSLKGSEYLDVKWRLVWFRQECPQGTIETHLIERTDTFALFRASVQDGRGGTASAHGSETKADFGDFVEKAETKAVGRALAYLGFGTQFAPELNEGERIADSPVEAQPARNVHQRAPVGSQAAQRPEQGKDTKGAPAPAQAAGAEPERLVCSECGDAIEYDVFFRDGTSWTPAVLAEYGRRKFGRVLCMTHYREAKGAREAAAGRD